MKLTPRCLLAYLAAVAPIAVVGCAGTFVGHLAVLAVTLGIFFGTLSLGRVSSPTTPSALAQPLAPQNGQVSSST